MQPCGLRKLAHPRGRLSFGLKARQVAGCARSSWAQRGLKNIHATLWAAGFGAPSGATVVWPQDQASCGMCPQNLTRKGAKKTIMQPCGLRDLARPRGRRSFGLKTKRFAGCARGTLAQRGLKNIPATLRAAGFGVPLGATVVWPQSLADCGLSPRYLSRKDSKKHSCNLADCGIWRALGGYSRLASRPSKLRIESAAPWPKGG